MNNLPDVSGRFERSQLLLGNDVVEMLSKVHVLVAGLGGVGSYTVEALARGGIGSLTIIDYAKVEIHNINRQLFALDTTIGQSKTLLAQQRIQLINPDCVVTPLTIALDEDNVRNLTFDTFSAVIDCIDDLRAKTALLAEAKARKVPVITTVMGASTRMNPSLVKVSDIQATTHCPVAKKVRKMLKGRGIESGINAVFSTEEPQNRNMRAGNHKAQQHLRKDSEETSMGSYSCLPGIFGLTAAQDTITRLIQRKDLHT